LLHELKSSVSKAYQSNLLCTGATKITVAILSDKLGQCVKWKTKLSEGSPKLLGDPSLKAGW
jgi:hypothetical protein